MSSLRRLVIIVFVLGVITALVSSKGSDAQVAGIWLLGVPTALTAIWVTWKYCIFIWRALNPIFEPVPSPPEIAARLEVEWGRPPTLVEVAAVHTMLIGQRNQCLICGGTALGAIYLLGHHDL